MRHTLRPKWVTTSKCHGLIEGKNSCQKRWLNIKRIKALRINLQYTTLHPKMAPLNVECELQAKLARALLLASELLRYL